MTRVRVLVDAVGEYNAGDIVNDAPAGLIEMAEKGTRNAATGELIAEIVSDSVEINVSEEVAILGELTEKANSLGIPDAETLSITELISAISKAEFDLLEQNKENAGLLEKQKAEKEMTDAAELSELKKQAKELKIEGYTKMNVDELKVAITAAGGGSDEQ